MTDTPCIQSGCVQYGCGWNAPDGWRNFDASPTLRFERLPLIGRMWTRNDHRFPANAEYGDIIKGLPLPAGSCSALYCSHVLEHLALADLRRALANSHALLAPGGRFRMVVPDLEQAVQAYFQAPAGESAATLLDGVGLGWRERPRGARRFLVEWLGNARHRWAWDYDSLAAELEAAGFSGIRRAHLGDSADPHFAEVEDPGRWENALGIECVK